MFQRKKLVMASISCIITLLGIVPAWAQSTPEKTLMRLEKLAEHGKSLKHRMGRKVDYLSAGGQMIVNIGERWDSAKPIFERIVERRTSLKKEDEKGEIDKSLIPFTGNHTFEKSDFFSRMAGSTQSETSVGWWGDNAVCGFNDTGSFAATLLPLIDTTLPPSPSPSGSFSFVGWSRSANEGNAFADKGALVSDPLPAGIDFRDLLGDPVVRATNSSTFYYASNALDSLSTGEVFSGISVSKSTNGGITWEGAVIAIEKDVDHLLEKPWMAVKSGLFDTIYITYTDFDFSGNFPRTAIEFVKSTDGGVSWSTPVVIDEVFGDAFVQGSQVTIGPNGEIYVAWERYDADFVKRSIKFRKSTNGGSTFGQKMKVSQVTHVGDSFSLQGNFRAFIDLQGLAVDSSGQATTGTIYITWHDGRNLEQRDVFGIDGHYRFADILLSKSSDRGSTWSVPVRVNNDPKTKKADQFMPAIAVDGFGSVGVLFYDRKYNLRNFLLGVTFARSINAGETWTNFKVSTKSFAPITGANDLFITDDYMGDYLAIASDASKINSGFIAAWGDNSLGDANISMNRLK